MMVREYTSHIAYLFALFKDAYAQMRLAEQGSETPYPGIDFELLGRGTCSAEIMRTIVEHRRQRLQRQGFDPYYDQDEQDWELKTLPLSHSQSGS